MNSMFKTFMFQMITKKSIYNKKLSHLTDVAASLIALMHISIYL